ncbi:hypothetical protein EXIGLDRAFT_829900 [Exidia glandulosa HHB12029]|uniref:Uncharacterized protein n=1 Tax=Exidia glandulosa HHB12029 TaxID=1314781 RepID=A0A165P687_EXIGL|nr:hypothetical protein EXIGLDRAFT_829900 [Exidia glandulosa HHB12029]
MSLALSTRSRHQPKLLADGQFICILDASLTLSGLALEVCAPLLRMDEEETLTVVAPFEFAMSAVDPPQSRRHAYELRPTAESFNERIARYTSSLKDLPNNLVEWSQSSLADTHGLESGERPWSEAFDLRKVIVIASRSGKVETSSPNIVVFVQHHVPCEPSETVADHFNALDGEQLGARGHEKASPLCPACSSSSRPSAIHISSPALFVTRTPASPSPNLRNASPQLSVTDLLGTREGIAATAKFIQRSGAFARPATLDVRDHDD